jgi:hypothetical protein
LPATQRKTNAFLVSLEGLQDFLPDQEGGGPRSGNTFDGDLNLRLAVLKSWEFFSTGQPATFVNQLESLNGRVPDGPPAANTDVRLAYAGNNPIVAGALNMGFVPLNETLRTAGKTVSWYRGPLLPYKVDQLNQFLFVPSPDAAMIFDPTTGMLDVSYAAAWTIGRMIALQDVAFSVSLYHWKKDVDQEISNAIEDTLIEETLGAALNLGPESKQLRQTEGGETPRGSRALLKRSLIALNPDKSS